MPLHPAVSAPRSSARRAPRSAPAPRRARVASAIAITFALAALAGPTFEASPALAHDKATKGAAAKNGAKTKRAARAGSDSASPAKGAKAGKSSADRAADAKAKKAAKAEKAKAAKEAKAAKAAEKAAAKAAAKAKARAKQHAKAWAACQPHKPQVFLQRSSFIHAGMLEPKKHEKALRFFAEHYGHVETESTRRWNTAAAKTHAKSVSFLGLRLSVHKKITPALKCVEKRVAATCKGKSRYVARAVGGFRDANTYRGAEVSNHLFGIAIDIDPARNPCCGCVEPWPSHPACKDEKASIYEKTELPKCMIAAFERYGFYWLGRDTLQDTMHFEFLGDPD